jgi:hypothetical protein
VAKATIRRKLISDYFRYFRHCRGLFHALEGILALIDPHGSARMHTTLRPIDDPIRSLRYWADSWGVSLDTVRRRIEARELAIVRLSPRRIGIRTSEAQRYLQEREGK